MKYASKRHPSSDRCLHKRKRYMKKIWQNRGRWIRTTDLELMGLPSFHCSIPHQGGRQVLPCRDMKNGGLLRHGASWLEPTARFYGSCFLPVGKMLRCTSYKPPAAAQQPSLVLPTYCPLPTDYRNHGVAISPRTKFFIQLLILRRSIAADSRW